jgi:hypothetical protein
VVIDRWEWPRGRTGEFDTGKSYSRHHWLDAVLAGENGVREEKILLGDIAEWEGVRKREALIPLEEKTRASQERL